MIDVVGTIVARDEQRYVFEYTDPRPDGDIPFITMQVEFPAVFPDPAQTALMLEHGVIGSTWRLRHTAGDVVELSKRWTH